MKGNFAHPLDQLSVEEITAASDYTNKFCKVNGKGTPRFNNITLKEPTRQELLAYAAGGPRPVRTAHVIATENSNRTPIEMDVDLDSAQVLGMEVIEGVITSAVGGDATEAKVIIKADPEVQSLVKEYGIPMDEITIDAWITCPGDIPTDRKWTAGFMYWQREKESNFYGHPLPFMPIVEEGLGKVVRIDNAYNTVLPVNKTPMEYHKDMVDAPFRTDLKSLQISQPDGPSFTVEGNLVKWQKWEVRIGFNYREGLVLHNIGYQDSGRLRPILHRMSIAEMVVPYGSPEAPFNKKMAFDAGDAGLGLLANSLQLGCDCLGTIKYFDGIVSNLKGEPVVIKNAICLHEEDSGTSWKHTDAHSGHCEVRRGRQLVFSFLSTLANYEYLFRFIFKTDASIEVDIKLTGIVSTHSVSPNEGDAPRHGTLLLPGVVAHIHQHLFCSRLDFAVDDETGGDNLAVSEVDVVVDESPENVYGNAFMHQEKEMTTESKAQRLIDASKSRFWKVKNPTKTNPISGLPIAYKLMLPNTPILLGKPGSVTMSRGAFATKNLWVTPYQPTEQWPGGKYPLQNPDACGVAKWTKQDREIKSPVVWSVFGVSHVVRAEDFPVMPVESTGIHIKPANFFGMNPANDLPPLKDHASVLFPEGEAGCCAGEALNGHANGLANGHANGINGHANGVSGHA